MAIRLRLNQFFGEVLACRPVGAAHLSVSRIEPGLAVPWHVHRSPYFSLVLEGGYRETHGESSAIYRSGDLVFRPAGFEHCDLVGELGALCLNVELDEGAPLSAAPKSVAAPGVARMARRALGGLVYSNRTDIGPSVLLEALFSALFEPEQRPAGSPAWLSEAIRAVEADPAHNWTLSSLASSCRVHPVHFCRSFRRATGVTLTAFVRRRRLEVSRQMLVEEQGPIGEIALDLGFADAAHFSRCFRSAFGESPSEFRRSGILHQG